MARNSSCRRPPALPRTPARLLPDTLVTVLASEPAPMRRYVVAKQRMIEMRRLAVVSWIVAAVGLAVAAGAGVVWPIG
jgi:hypothetical protein